MLFLAIVSQVLFVGFCHHIAGNSISFLDKYIRFIVRYNDAESYMQASLDIDKIIWLLDRYFVCSDKSHCL